MEGRKVAATVLLAFAVSGTHAQDVEEVASLPSLNIDTRQHSVSGISSGGYMAQQFHTAYSDVLIGAGIVAGGPYYCAENSLTIALARCLDPDEAVMPDPSRLAWLTDEFAADNRIAAPSHMADDPIWVFASPEDATVSQNVGDTLIAYYRHFVPDEKIVYVNDLPAAHSMPTLDFGFPCDHVGNGNNADDHFINDCDYDAAGEILKHTYRRMHARNASPSGRLIKFPQADFIAAPRSHAMGDHGYAYIPPSCDQGARCRVHVVFHGCRQYEERIGDAFFGNAGYNQWADKNRLVVLYPQTVPTPSQGNPNGCWDWWGFDDAHYMWRDGRQMQAIKGMMDRLAGAQTDTVEPAAPTGIGASINLDASVELSWNTVDDPQVQGYLVYKSEVAGGPYLSATAQAIAEPRLTLTDLEPGNHYFVIVALGAEALESLPTPELAVNVPGL